MLCSTDDYTVNRLPAPRVPAGAGNLYGVSSATRFNVEHVFSTDGGSTWIAVPDSMMSLTLLGGATRADDKTLVPFGAMDLTVGTSYQFGLRLSRVEGTANPGFYCANFVQIRNRNAASPPL